VAGTETTKTVEESVGAVHDMAAETMRRGRDEMPLAAAQHKLIQNTVPVKVRALAAMTPNRRLVAKPLT